MTMKKSLLSSFLILCFSIFLIACSTDGTNETINDNEGSAENQEDDGYEIATVVKVTGEAWFDRMEQGVDKFNDDTEHNAFQQGPQEADAEEQIKIIEDLIAQNVDAISVVPFSAESLEPVLEKARDEGIVVITHEADGLENVDYNIEAFNNEEYGEFIMDNLAESMGEEGEYMTAVGSLTSNSHMEWVEAAEKRQKDKYPDMTPVETEVETSDDLEKASEKLRESLKAHPDLEGFQGSASTDAPGAALALEELGKEDQVSIVGTSVPSVSGQYIEDGSLDAITFWDPADAAYVMNELAVMVLDGEEDNIKDGLDLKVDGYEDLEVKDDKYLYGDAYQKVDQENLDEYEDF